MSQAMAAKLLPATIDDIDALMDVGRRAFAQDQLTAAIKAQVPEDTLLAYRRARLEKALIGNYMRCIKVVVNEDGTPEGKERIVAYAGWIAAKAKDNEAEAQQLEALMAADPVISSSLHGQTEKKIEERSDELLGKDRKSRYWYLASLCTDPGYQGRGYGLRLVKWGIEQAKADAQARPGEVDGAFLVATPAGLRTYLKAGMTRISDMIIDYGKGSGENGWKFVWLVERF